MGIIQIERRIALRSVYYGFVGLLLVACGTITPQLGPSQPTVPTPTLAAIFRESPTDIQPTPGIQESHTALAVTAETQMPVPTPTDSTTDQIAVITLYDDTLNTDWVPEHSDMTKYDLASTDFIHAGKKAIKITPTNDYGRFFLTVGKDARKTYPRDRVLGFSFWLNGGASTIATSDLAVTVVGSNQYAYWVIDDQSVKIDTPVTVESPLFSETRLYYLHFNRSIPPDTWVEVVVWLDDLLYDPDYKYVTGMYIKNDEGFVGPYYIDDVQLLVQKGA